MAPQLLLNPRNLTRTYPDARSGEVMRKTVEFFEAKGKVRLVMTIVEEKADGTIAVEQPTAWVT